MLFLLIDTLMGNNINITENVVVKNIETASTGISWDTVISVISLIVTLSLAAVSIYRTRKDRINTERKIRIAAKQSILYQMQNVLSAMSELYDAIEKDDKHQTDETISIVKDSFASFDKEATRLTQDIANIPNLTNKDREIMNKAFDIMDEFFNKLSNDQKSALNCKLRFSSTITELRNANAD